MTNLSMLSPADRLIVVQDDYRTGLINEIAYQARKVLGAEPVKVEVVWTGVRRRVNRPGTVPARIVIRSARKTIEFTAGDPGDRFPVFTMLVNELARIGARDVDGTLLYGDAVTTIRF